MNTRSKDSILQLYNKFLPALASVIHQEITPLISMFHDFNLEKVVDTWTREPGIYYPDPLSIENGNIEYLGLQLRLEGYNRSGVLPFDLYKELVLKLGPVSYGLGGSKNDIWLEKSYGQNWARTEMEEITEKWCGELLDEMTRRLERLMEGRE
jgi:hypothetical protein